jgi:hypothetical protein
MGGKQSVEVPGGGSEGYHVLKVLDNSPAKKAGMQAYFDFLVSIDGVRLNQENDTLKQILEKYMDKPVKVSLYNSKTRTTREVELVPTNTWGGQGLLGVSIRFCSFEGATENIWHVLEIHPNSPAAQAGLIPHSDYILGSEMMSAGDDDLYSLIESHDHQEIKLYVYNADTDNCREVSLTPDSEWGGEGSLGCGIGYGYLHRLPTHSKTSAGGGAPTSSDLEAGGAQDSSAAITSPPRPPPPAEGYCDVPLSVPSNPATPSMLTSSSPSTTAVSVAQTQAGLQELRLTDSPTPPSLPSSTLTPAPVTVIRTAPGGPPLPTTTTEQLLGDRNLTNVVHSQTNTAGMTQLGAVQSHYSTGGQQGTAVGGTPYRMTDAQFSGAVAGSTTMQGQTGSGIGMGTPQQLFQQSGVVTNVGGGPVTAPLQTSMHHYPPSSTSLPPLSSSSSLPPPGTQGNVTSINAHHSIPAVWSGVPPAFPPGVLTSLPPSATPQSSLLGGTASIPPLAAPLTVSGLPSIPPTISFPSIAPKISLNPSPAALPRAVPTTTVS